MKRPGCRRPPGRKSCAYRGTGAVGPAKWSGCLLAMLLLATAAGCGTAHPRRLSAQSLAEAQTFPYYKLYWVGPNFAGQPLAAVDGQRVYISSFGDSVYYGDCVHGKGIFGGGSCLLPLQVTTVVYRLHSNSTLGPQRNVVVRGVPATVYDEGRSIEVYTGRVAVDIFSYDYSHALAAATKLLPLNAPGSASGDLPPPVYCPGLSGTLTASVARVLGRLPGRVCQRAAAAEAFAKTFASS
jgi:hypothetical protein